MFQTFTGSSRRPRQVNLSGRNTNVFAAVGGTGGPPAPQNALVNAQQEREKRQKERERQNAAKTIQRSWRGATCRKGVAHRLRQQYDEAEAQGAGSNAGHELDQLRRLLQFFNSRSAADVERLRTFAVRHVQDVQGKRLDTSGGPWPVLYLRLETIALEACERAVKTRRSAGEQINIFLELLSFLATIGPSKDLKRSTRYYQVIREVTEAYISSAPAAGEAEGLQSTLQSSLQPLVAATIAPLQRPAGQTLDPYEAFGYQYLASPQLLKDAYLSELLPLITGGIDYRLLARALATVLRNTECHGHSDLRQATSQLSVLSFFIYFHRHAHSFESGAFTSERDFIVVVSHFLGSLADDVELETTNGDEAEGGLGRSMHPPKIEITDRFVTEQLRSLVNRESVGSLLQSTGSEDSIGSMDDGARQLASYALALVRFFPREADEIRLWLFRGSSNSSTPVIKYFWNVSKNTKVFRAISQDPKAAIGLLKNRGLVNGQSYQSPASLAGSAVSVADDWRVLLIFLELYTFVLRVMDDDEFISASKLENYTAAQSSSVRSNALPLDAVRDLTKFLKNLGFTMYFYAATLMDTDERDAPSEGLSSYFRVSQSARRVSEVSREEQRIVAPSVAGIAGMTMDHVKQLVTGLLRGIYDRDSRRKFLPKDHWLLTTHFEIDNFITAVVSEEESSEASKDQDAEDEEEEIDDVDFTFHDQPHLAGNSRVRQTQYQQLLETQQRRVAKKRHLQALAPRRELLQNMPFIIPFRTRVQIFREFVLLDKIKTHYPARGEIGAYAATVKRGHEFEDAYDELFELKAGLKGPISITFTDRFGEAEAGIDGGGVTKEFLTSVTNQAFSEPIDSINLFVENDQHLLYPNPTAVEEKRELLKQTGLPQEDPVFRMLEQELLNRYEFLGRIIGKCMYEGILIDINFAGFFLRKWALTNGQGNALNESGYHANIDDLRELDEVLYQNLLKLKNYPGNVEDFSVDFTIADTIHLPDGREKTIPKDLVPDGSNIPVTNENRLLYMKRVAQHRLSQQPRKQTHAFLQGLASIIKPAWLRMFNQSELQTLVGGTSSQISVADLKANTQYGGVYQVGDDGLLHPTIEHFWQVMESLEDSERRAVLKFVTSTPNAPLLGFGSLNPRFGIRDSGDDQSRLPSTSTCVNLLKLPRYTNVEVLKERLLYAANSKAGFDLS